MKRSSEGMMILDCWYWGRSSVDMLLNLWGLAVEGQLNVGLWNGAHVAVTRSATQDAHEGLGVFLAEVLQVGLTHLGREVAQRQLAHVDFLACKDIVAQLAHGLALLDAVGLDLFDRHGLE